MNSLKQHSQESPPSNGDLTKAKWIAGGGVLGAILASACCVLPLALVTLGVSGAWIGQMALLSAYQPIIMVVTFGLLGYGCKLVYFKPKIDCMAEQACARPLPNKLVKMALWIAMALTIFAFIWPYLVPLIFE